MLAAVPLAAEVAGAPLAVLALPAVFFPRRGVGLRRGAQRPGGRAKKKSFVNLISAIAIVIVLIVFIIMSIPRMRILIIFSIFTIA